MPTSESPQKALSVVIPVFNGGECITRSVSVLDKFLSAAGISFEIIVVDDGSTDDTAVQLMGLALPSVRFFALPHNVGKFGALKRGVAESVGECVVFTDADLPFDLEAITYIYKLVTDRGFHIVIGDRSLRTSRYAQSMNPLRRGASSIFSLVVRMFVAGGLFDTQCGLKGFRGGVARHLFPLVKTNGFSGDVELLYIGLKYNLEVKRIPVRLRNVGTTSVRVLAHSVGMMCNISALKWRWISGQYHNAYLVDLSSQRYWESEECE